MKARRLKNKVIVQFTHRDIVLIIPLSIINNYEQIPDRQNIIDMTDISRI
jgi:hypothetical protein